jgi:hypothetical protein
MASAKSSDPSATVVILLSFGLFALALFVKGFAHDLLLEAGVFLVSLKLILMARKNAENGRRIEAQFTKLEDLLVQRTTANPQA